MSCFLVSHGFSINGGQSTPDKMLTLFIVALCFILAAMVLLLHHGYKHSQEDPSTSHAQRESCGAVCYFQLKDISNHETWILVFTAIGITLFIVGANNQAR